MHNDRIKVLYIAGWGRSGSTILGSILGEIDGFFFAGELPNLWGRNLIENKLCGCGLPFRECEVWNAVLDEAFGGMDQINAIEMIHLRDRGARTRYTPLMLMPRGKQLLTSRMGEYLANIERLYRAIQSSTGSKVIVDSSKFPPYGYVLEMIPAIELYVIHLVRDPRAVAYSWLRKKLLQPVADDSLYMQQYGRVRSSLQWVIRNLTTEAFWRGFPERYLMLRYEDFVDRSQEAVRRILDLVGEKPHLPFVTERGVELKLSHAVWGNPSRFRTGWAELRPDDEWKGKIKRSDKIIVTALTWPLLLRYGYRVRVIDN